MERFWNLFSIFLELCELFRPFIVAWETANSNLCIFSIVRLELRPSNQTGSWWPRSGTGSPTSSCTSQKRNPCHLRARTENRAALRFRLASYRGMSVIKSFSLLSQKDQEIDAALSYDWYCEEDRLLLNESQTANGAHRFARSRRMSNYASSRPFVALNFPTVSL